MTTMPATGRGFDAATAFMYAPAIWLLAFWSLVWRARVHLGEWPHASRGSFFTATWEYASVDPKLFHWHYGAVMGITLVGALAVVFGTTWLVLVFLTSNGNRPTRATTIVFLASSALAIAMVWLNLGGFWSWFMD